MFLKVALVYLALLHYFVLLPFFSGLFLDFCDLFWQNGELILLNVFNETLLPELDAASQGFIVFNDYGVALIED